MSKVKKIIIAALIFVVLAIVAMIPIPYVIESPGTAEDVSQFLTINGGQDEDPGSLRVLTVYVEQATVLTYLKKFLEIIRQKNTMTYKISVCVMHVQPRFEWLLKRQEKRLSDM